MKTVQRVSDFRERFNVLYAESDKTNTDLGKDLHVSNQTISAWRYGIRSPKEPTIRSIADYFGVSVKWLLGFDVPRSAGASHPRTQEAAEIAAGIDKLPEAKRKQALNVLKAMFEDVF